jgi:hypothetical protein
MPVHLKRAIAVRRAAAKTFVISQLSIVIDQCPHLRANGQLIDDKWEREKQSIERCRRICLMSGSVSVSESVSAFVVAVGRAPLTEDKRFALESRARSYFCSRFHSSLINVRTSGQMTIDR